MLSRESVVLPRRVVPQPAQRIVEGGDCGACCIAGVLGISIQQAYDLQDKDERMKDAKDKPVSFGWHNLGLTLKYGGWCGNDYTDSVVDSVPMWPYELHKSNAHRGFPSWSMGMAWWQYVRMGLFGGFYGICQVGLDGGGPLGSHDHWVMICGAKEEAVPLEHMPGASRIDMMLLISCSARHPQGEWRDVFRLLRDYGGYNVIMVRPRVAKESGGA